MHRIRRRLVCASKSRKVERIESPAWNQTEFCDSKHINVTPSTHATKYLNFIFPSASRFAISIHVILSRGRKSQAVKPAALSLHSTSSEITAMPKSPSQTSPRTSRMPASLSWSTAGPSQTPVVWHSQRAVLINLKTTRAFLSPIRQITHSWNGFITHWGWSKA